MNNINRYDFGTSLRDVVMYGIDEKKEIRILFEEQLYIKTGIKALHSSFMPPHYIMISVDTEKSSEIFAENDVAFINGSYYPKGKLFSVMANCFNIAADGCGLPNIEFSEIELPINISDYKKTFRNIYFDLNYKNLNCLLKREFPNVNFIMVPSRDSFGYYIIFDNDLDMHRAERDALTDRIIDFVDSHCKNDQTLLAFKITEKIYPKITTKEALSKSNKLFAVLRDYGDLLMH